MLDYKLRGRGRVLIRVDRRFPSSQLCSACGRREPSVKDLSVRTWTCPACGAVHDRDLNAAVNILREGIRSYKAMTVYGRTYTVGREPPDPGLEGLKACGDCVRRGGVSQCAAVSEARSPRFRTRQRSSGG